MTTRQEFIDFIYPIDLEEIIRVNEGEINLHEAPVPDLDSIGEISNLISRLEQEKDNTELWPENRRTIHLPNILLRLKGRRYELEFADKERQKQRAERKEKLDQTYFYQGSEIESISVFDVEEALKGKLMKLYQELDDFLEKDRQIREDEPIVSPNLSVQWSRTSRDSRFREKRGGRPWVMSTVEGAHNTKYRRITEWYREEIANLEALQDEAKKVVNWKSSSLDHLLKNENTSKLFNTLKKNRSLIEAAKETIIERNYAIISLLLEETNEIPLPFELRVNIGKIFINSLKEELEVKLKLVELESKYKWQEWSPKLKNEAKSLFASAKKQTIEKIKSGYTYSLYECITDLFLSFKEEINKLEMYDEVFSEQNTRSIKRSREETEMEAKVEQQPVFSKKSKF